MPFIGIYKNLFPSSNKEKKSKEIIRVTFSSLTFEAREDNGNKYDVINQLYKFSFWKLAYTKELKFKSGESYLAEVSHIYQKPIGALIGSVRLVRINSFGSVIYL